MDDVYKILPAVIFLFAFIFVIVLAVAAAIKMKIKPREKNEFGLIFWLISIFFFPWSLIYVGYKISKSQKKQNKKILDAQNEQNKYQELYYKELYEEQKRKNEKARAEENNE